MLPKRKLPIGALFMILVLALATVGIGYGLWSETLTIAGSVYTGSLDAGLSLQEVDQMDDFNDICPADGYSIGQDCDGDGNLNDDMEAEGKDIAECVALFDEKDANILHVMITNAYPSFNCFIKWDVHNEGTIPMHVYGPAYFIGDVYFGNSINTAELHVNGWPPPCYASATTYEQLEPGETAYCNLHVHVNQAAEMGATYTFNVRVFARQWNEIVEPPYLPLP